MLCIHSDLVESGPEFRIEVEYVWISYLSGLRYEKDSIGGKVVGASPPHPLFDGYKLKTIPISLKRNNILPRKKIGKSYLQSIIKKRLEIEFIIYNLFI
jgi:hypothetical protein